MTTRRPDPGSAVFARPCGPRPEWLWFERPVGAITATVPGEIIPALQAVEAALKEGLHAAGFIAYEAAPAFDSALQVRDPCPLPLVLFHLYREPAVLPGLDAPGALPPELRWQSDTTWEEFRHAIGRIKDYIAAGDTYQVNYSFRLRAPWQGDAWSFFAHLVRAQQTPSAAFMDTGRHVICSASPELFFFSRPPLLTTRPMKGTAPRGLWSLQDLARAAQLRRSAKTRAENLMIVDMVRNDLGRIAVPGSVRVSGLFAVEQYETVWQMTSTVEASTAARLPDILRALFPCASVTGAPKVRTMQIIAELEQSPRGIYTGCMGYLAPDGRAQFNVAIRTAHIDRELERAEYGVGGGILWGSSARREFDECLTKARVLGGGAPSFELLETLLWEPGSGYALLDGHLRRLGASARYFAFDVDAAAVKRRLLADAAAFPRRPRRVRLLVSRTGSVRLETQDCAAGTLTLHPPAARGPGAPAAWRVRLAPEPVRAEDRFLYHKTTRRDVYERARASCPDCDDVILWNASGEVTESTIANIVTRSRGRLLTPPVSAGLLPGVFRERLLRRRVIAEAPIVRADLARSEAVYLINSVRGWIPCRLDSPDGIQDQPRTRRNAT